MKPMLILKRNKPKPHYEIHFVKHVEYWTLDGEKLGETEVETVK